MRRLDLEYPLSTKSERIVWEQISTAHGLERWLADYVMAHDGVLDFQWGEDWTERDVRTARVVALEPRRRIRLKWVESDDGLDDDAYWEMRLTRSELTGELNLLVTDFAHEDDYDGLRILWESNFDRLHRSCGL